MNVNIHRPLWAAGALLSPQQFQQQGRYEAWATRFCAQLTLAHPWGVQAVGFDQDALRLGKLKATRLSLCLADGTPVDTGQFDQLPGALELSRLLADEVQSVVVLLALPLEQANGNNCLFAEGRADRPQRYRQVWREVQDLYGDEVQSIGVLEHALSLRLDSDDNADYLTCPLARLVRATQGGWELDSNFIPPLLSFDGHPGLLAMLENLLTQLSAKRERLMGMRRESNQRMADFAVADVTLFWLLNALNSCHPLLVDLKAHPGRHPEQVYQMLAPLAGSLLTFSLDQRIDCIPDAAAELHRRAGTAPCGRARAAPAVGAGQPAAPAQLPGRRLGPSARLRSTGHGHAAAGLARQRARTVRDPGRTAAQIRATAGGDPGRTADAILPRPPGLQAGCAAQGGRSGQLRRHAGWRGQGSGAPLETAAVTGRIVSWVAGRHP